MKILFVVCGEGLGHASRCLHLGHYLQNEGHTVHFATYGKAYDFINEHGCTNLHRSYREVCLEGEDGFFSLKKTLWCSKWIVLNIVRSALRVRHLIRDYDFDCVVADTMFGGIPGAKSQKKPVVFITNQNHFNGPGATTNPVWKILNFLIRRYIRFADHIIIPDYPKPDTVSEYNIVIPKGQEHRYSLVGPLFELDCERYPCELNISSKKTIFTSFGGEPYKLPLYQMLKTIADQRKDLLFDVFYTGAALPESSDNFLSHGYVSDIYDHLAKARIAIVHGGLTTLHEALLFEKPVLIIMDPNHPEQQNNAKKIVDMGAGTAVDGRKVLQAVLQQKLAETFALTPKPFRKEHAHINGRKHAAEIITSIGNAKKS